MAEYPAIPHRPNFVDIRTQQVYDPKVIEFHGSAHPSGVGFEQLYPAGATLEVGVHIRQHHGRRMTFITTTGLSGDAGNSTTDHGGGYTSGFELGLNEEIFIPIRQLGDVWIARGNGSGASPRLTYYAR